MASLRTTGSRGPPDRHFYVAHPSIGVAKESYSMKDLLADDFQFQARESRMLQTNRQRAAVDNTVATMD